MQRTISQCYLRFCDREGASYFPTDHYLGREDSGEHREPSVLSCIRSIELYPDGHIVIAFMNRIAISVAYEPLDQGASGTTVTFRVDRGNDPCEELLKPEDAAAKRKSGEPEDGYLRNVSLKRLVGYLEDLAFLSVHCPTQGMAAVFES